jgi:hypothetical protein
MSIMLIGAMRWFSAVTEEIGSPEIRNLYFYNSAMRQGLSGPVLSLLPFVDLIVFDASAYRSHRLEPLRREAEKLKIPLVYER